MRAVRDERDDVHLGDHLHIFARRGETVGELQSAVRRHRHVHEEIDVVGDVALRQAEMVVLGDREQEAVAAGVHRLLVERVADGVALGRAGAADRVVTADGVGGDGQHRPAEIRPKDRAGARDRCCLAREWCRTPNNARRDRRRCRTACRRPDCLRGRRCGSVSPLRTTWIQYSPAGTTLR